MLNEHQISAVNHGDGPCLTLAGPGSGKTTVLVERILRLIENEIDPSKILVITFTKDAASEMKERFIAKAAGESYPVSFGTFHSIFYKILLSHPKYKGVSILNSFQKQSLLQESCFALGDISVDPKDKDFLESVEKEISKFINCNKNIDSDFSEYLSDETFLLLIKEYERRKDEHRTIDFDDMLLKTYELLTSDKRVLEKWQKRFEYYLVDEIQDINELQFNILQLLCVSKNIFAVGDDDQSIYGFRGSSPGFMLDFPNVYPNCKIIQLNINYRSASDIVKYSKNLIAHNKERFVKDYHPANENKGKISLVKHDNTYEEAKKILSMLLYDTPNITTGILYRNRNQANILATLLDKNKIPYFTKEKPKDMVIKNFKKDIYSYFNLLYNIDKPFICTDDILRVMNKPNRGITRAGLNSDKISIKNWLSFYPKNTKGYYNISQFTDNLNVASRLSPIGAWYYIKNIMGYNDIIKNTEGILDYIASFEEEIAEYKDIRELVKSFKEEPESFASADKDCNIFLYTFHGSKGLEFDRVFLLDVNEGITPYKNAESISEIEEERRMFYVAATRAKSELILNVVSSINENTSYPSRFVEELGLEDDNMV